MEFMDYMAAVPRLSGERTFHDNGILWNLWILLYESYHDITWVSKITFSKVMGLENYFFQKFWGSFF